MNRDWKCSHDQKETDGTFGGMKHPEIRMKVFDITPISLNDWRVLKTSLENEGVPFKVFKEDLLIMNDVALDEAIEKNSEIRDLLTNIEESLYD